MHHFVLHSLALLSAFVDKILDKKFSCLFFLFSFIVLKGFGAAPTNGRMDDVREDGRAEGRTDGRTDGGGVITMSIFRINIFSCYYIAPLIY